ncbi:hypothetical protein ACP4OV_027825 [Aristida adscensionis]
MLGWLFSWSLASDRQLTRLGRAAAIQFLGSSVESLLACGDWTKLPAMEAEGVRIEVGAGGPGAPMDLEGVGAPRRRRRRRRRTRRQGSRGAGRCCAYQSFGVVYGDVATSLLYVYKSTVADDNIEHLAGYEEIYGVLSFVFWTLALITFVKDVLIVLCAVDSGKCYRGCSC